MRVLLGLPSTKGAALMPNLNLPAEPAPEASRLRAVRVRAPEQAPEGMDAPDLPVFEGGESLDEQLRDDWSDASGNLEDAEIKYDPTQSVEEAIAEHIDARYSGLPWSDPRSDPIGDVRKAMEDIVMQGSTHLEVTHPGLVEPGIPNGTRHLCPVEPCGWFMDVPPVSPDLGSLLGGVSAAMLEQAREVEERLEAHLETHSILEWTRALRTAQQERDDARQGLMVQAAPAIREGYAEDGAVIPGPARRDPVREAAVRAVDARLGRNVGGTLPTDGLTTAARDDFIRAEFARKRQQTLAPTDLTPRYTADLEPGVVGIKR